ncbi:MAG: hypothetical protein M5U26_13685 [Planctomycetota bacterium]|nr:hypothetical protein [Planctomycetota bacterium]
MAYRWRRGVTRTILAAWILALAAIPARAGEAEVPPAEEVFPAETVLGFFLPSVDRLERQLGATRTAEMLRRPEMQAFFAPAVERIAQQWEAFRAKEPKLEQFGEARSFLFGMRLDVGVWFGGAGPQDAHAAGLVRFGPGASLRERLAKDLGRAPAPDGERLELGLGQDSAATLVGNGLLVVDPPEILPQIFARTQGGDPGKRLAALPGFAAAREHFKDSLGWGFFAWPQILKEVEKEEPEDERERMRRAFSLLGFDKLGLWSAGLSLRDGVVSGEMRMNLNEAGARAALLDCMLGRDPIPAEALKLVAKDAPFAFGWRFDTSKLLPLVRDAMALEQNEGMLDLALEQMQQMLGFKLQEDLLANLKGDYVFAATRLHSGPPLVSWGPGLVGSVGLHRPEKMAECLEKLKAVFLAGEREGTELTQSLRWKELDFGGQKAHYLSGKILGGGLVFAVVGDRLLLSNAPNAMRMGLEQLKAPDDLRAHEPFRKTLERLTGRPFDPAALPPGFAYEDAHESGTGTLLMSMIGLGAATAVLCVVSEQPALANLQAPQAPVLPNLPPLAAVNRFLGRPAGRTLLSLLQGVDLGLWPDAGFFAQFDAPHGMVLEFAPEGWRMRSDLPPPMPGGGNTELAAIAVVAVGAGLALPVLARARGNAKRTQSASNLSQMGKACMMFADVEANQGRYPKDPAQLMGGYIVDARLFQNPLRPGQDIGYIYLAGYTLADGVGILAYEEIDLGAEGRNALFADGHVEWLDEESFQQALKESIDQLKEEGRGVTKVPVSFAKMQAAKEAFGKDQGAPPAQPEQAPPREDQPKKPDEF